MTSLPATHPTALAEELDVDALIVEALSDALDDADPDTWAVTDERSADWAMAKIRQARSQAQVRSAPARRAIAVLEERAAELQSQVDKIDAAAQRDVDFFEAKLIDWHRALIAADDDPKKRHTVSVTLGNGALRSRATPERIDVLDVAQVPGEFLVPQDPKPDRRAMLAWFRETGEVPSGTTVVPSGRNFTVEC